MRTTAVIDEPGSQRATAEQQYGDGCGSTAGELAALVEHVAQAERHLAQAVGLVGRVAGSGVCERVEGLPLEHFLGLAGRMTGADRRMLVAAGEVLRDLPATGVLFAEGKLSWGQVRGIVASVRSLPKVARAEVDARIAETARMHGGVDGFDPDQLLDAVTVAAAELRDARSVERREQRRAQSDFVALQSNLEGGVQLYGQCNDPVLAATVVNAFDDAAEQPQATTGKPEHGEASTRARQYAKGLGRICRAWLNSGPDQPDNHNDDAARADGPSGNPVDDFDAARDAPVRPDADDHSAAGPRTPSGDAPRPQDHPASADGNPKDAGQAHGSTDGARGVAGKATDGIGGAAGPPSDAASRSSGRGSRAARPLLIAHIDIADIARATAATIELNLRGPLPTISLKVLEQLGIDADLRTVIFDGARPLAVSGKVRAATIPAVTRLAVRARDRGCRFPGSRDPIGHCDIHHLVERSRGGDHHPDNLVNLSRRHHTLTHRHGWKLTLDATTGEITATRGKRRWRSLPRATRLARAPATEPGDPASEPPDTSRSSALQARLPS